MEIEKVELVWMQREDRGGDGTAQRGKGAARQCTVRRTGKCSKRVR